MPNFFTDNADLLFQFEHLNIQEIVALMERNYAEAREYNYAPTDYQDAVDNYRKVLEIVGDIAGNFVAPRAAEVDLEEAQIENGKV
ncbi:MAG: acyl-CoA dehydrogenase, partial [bacterium]